MRVLVVEDEPLVRELIAEILVDEGLEADGVAYAEEALVLLGSGERIDLLVTDIDLGDGLTGIDLAEIARSRFPDVALLFISGNAEDRLGRAPRPNEHRLRKPFRKEELLRVVHEVRQQVR